MASPESGPRLPSNVSAPAYGLCGKRPSQRLISCGPTHRQHRGRAAATAAAVAARVVIGACGSFLRRYNLAQAILLRLQVGGGLLSRVWRPSPTSNSRLLGGRRRRRRRRRQHRELCDRGVRLLPSSWGGAQVFLVSAGGQCRSCRARRFFVQPTHLRSYRLLDH